MDLEPIKTRCLSHLITCTQPLSSAHTYGKRHILKGFCQTPHSVSSGFTTCPSGPNRKACSCWPSSVYSQAGAGKQGCQGHRQPLPFFPARLMSPGCSLTGLSSIFIHARGKMEKQLGDNGVSPNNEVVICK